MTIRSCFLIKSLCLIRSCQSELFKKHLVLLGVTARVLTMACKACRICGPHHPLPQPPSPAFLHSSHTGLPAVLPLGPCRCCSLDKNSLPPDSN